MLGACLRVCVRACVCACVRACMAWRALLVWRAHDVHAHGTHARARMADARRRMGARLSLCGHVYGHVCGLAIGSKSRIFMNTGNRIQMSVLDDVYVS